MLFIVKISSFYGASFGFKSFKSDSFMGILVEDMIKKVIGMTYRGSAELLL